MARKLEKAKNPFVNKNFFLIVILLLFIPITIYLLQKTFSLFQHADESTHIQLQPNQTVLRSGQTATINVISVNEKQLLTGARFKLTYPTQKLEIQSINTSASTYSKTEYDETQPGTIQITAQSEKPLEGNNFIAQIKVSAKDLADTQEIYAPDGAEVDVTNETGNSTTSVPVSTVYGEKAENFNQKSSILQSLITSILTLFQNDK